MRVQKVDESFREKARLHNPSKITYAENGQICCSICKNTSKSMYYLCKSRRHVICEDCNGSESIKNRNDDGDNIPDNEYDTSGAKEISNIFSSKTKAQNYASGDHIETMERFKVTVNKTEETKSKSSSNTHRTTTNVETTINYINDNYNESQSSIASSNILLSKSTSKQKQNCEIVARPVRCPVTHCSRMVIISSFFQHFNFDHSKVPKMILHKSEPQEILITYSTLSSATNCLAILMLPRVKRSRKKYVNKLESPKSLSGLEKSDQLNFLMVAKLDITCVKQYSNRYVSTRTQYTQTGPTQSKNKLMMPLKSLTISNSGNIANLPDKSINLPNNDNRDEVLLLWLCSLDYKERAFTVTVSRTDKKQGYSYIGHAVHIREQQDPLSIYNRQECLSVRKMAVDKLVSENELKVFVSIVQ